MPFLALSLIIKSTGNGRRKAGISVGLSITFISRLNALVFTKFTL